MLAVTFPQDTFVGPVAALLFMEFIYNTNTNTYLQYTIINCSLCIENTCMYWGDQIKSNYTVYNRGNTVEYKNRILFFVYLVDSFSGYWYILDNFCFTCRACFDNKIVSFNVLNRYLHWGWWKKFWDFKIDKIHFKLVLL